MTPLARRITTRLSNALANPPLAKAQVLARIHSRIHPKLPQSWSIDGVWFSPGPLALDPQIRQTLRSMYIGTYETPTRVTIQNLLKPGGTFVDIGANIGYFTAVGAAMVGPTGTVHAFEPVPRYADYIQVLADNNPASTIKVNRFALGSSTSAANIDVAGPRNIGWNSMVSDMVDRSYHRDGTTTPHGHELEEQIEVPIYRFEEYARQHSLTDINLMKVDVEGWEIHVLRGMGDMLEYDRPPIICEISPHIIEATGSNVNSFLDWLSDHRYRSVDLVTGRDLSLWELFETRRQSNALFLPR